MWKYFARQPLLHKGDIINRFSLRFKFPQTSYHIIYPSVFLSTPTHIHVSSSFMCCWTRWVERRWLRGRGNFLSSTILQSSLWHPEWDADQSESKKNTKKGRLNRRALGRKEVYRETERRYWILNRSRRNEIAFTKGSAALPSFSFISSPFSL